ncbi:ABC transporter permease [Clostridium cagae]|uniref:ABC transporter permease n=1 Tax=Clostridium cagae TaxID=2080751 RepID=UPI003F7684C9
MLCKKSFKANKIRTILTIFSIILTTVLFTSLFTLAFSICKSAEISTMLEQGNSSNFTLQYLTKYDFNKMKEHPLVKDIGISIPISKITNKEFINSNIQMLYCNEIYARCNFSYPKIGTFPIKSNEIMTSTKVLDMFNIPHNIGACLSLNGKNFVLTGFYDNPYTESNNKIYVSEEFLKNNFIHYNELNSDKIIVADIILKNNFNVNKKINRILKDCNIDSDINLRINWSYDFICSPEIIFSLSLVISFITFTGYLIIYNIFHISIVKDIQFWGLLKTLGTTSKQIKKILFIQALFLSIIGIPIGIFLGYIISIILLPIINKTLMNNLLAYQNIHFSLHPNIFILTTIFSLITVFIACIKPSKVAAHITPIEAINYCHVSKNNIFFRKNINTKGKIYKMAFLNLFRDIKKSIIIVISLSLSLILFNAVFNIVNNYNVNIYLQENSLCDFQVSNKNFFSYFTFQYNNEDMLPNSLISLINRNDYIKERGYLYFDDVPHTVSIDALNNINNTLNLTYPKSEYYLNEKFDEFKKTGKCNIKLYGMNDFLLEKLLIIQGDLNLEKFKEGNYILICPTASNYNNTISYYKIGDRITIKYDDFKTKTYEVMGFCTIPDQLHSNSNGFHGDKNSDFNIECILPDNEFKNQFDNPLLASYYFNVDNNKINEMQNFLENYTMNIDSNIKYKSTATYICELKSFQRSYSIVGYVLVLIIGLIGILNFINSFVTEIISYEKEFAILESIGMTKKQILKLLTYEGLYYAILTILFEITIGIYFSSTIIKSLTNNITYINYCFKLTPIFISSSILIVISIILPRFIYKNTHKKSLIDRLENF